MGDTAKLLRLYRIDQQLEGLKGRLNTAERYLRAQEAKLREIDERVESLRSQARQLEATAHNDENESTLLEDRIAKLRERMNQAKTSKEHSALLVEINTLKADKSKYEEKALGSMSALDEVRQQLTDAERERAEVEKVRSVAEKDRDERAAEIRDRLTELEDEREKALQEVPAYALGMYKERLTFGIDSVMSPVIEQDRRNMEYTCEVSNTVLPIELVNKLLSRSEVVTCPVSDAILYLPDDLRETLETAAEKKRKKREVAANKD
jgi:predicted  nucleic acid-binding Zn-ribbon protein